MSFIYIEQSFTEAKHSKDAVINPPIHKVKTLLPLSNKNNSNFCKSTRCHGMLHLQENKIELII